jgi:hypothetical protein
MACIGEGEERRELWCYVAGGGGEPGLAGTRRDSQGLAGTRRDSSGLTGMKLKLDGSIIDQQSANNY